MNLKNKTVLVTGPTSGIGLELAKLFAKDGCGLILVARNVSKLEEIKKDFIKQSGVTVEIVGADLRDVDAPQRIFEEIKNRHLSVDMLVNNAGVGVYGDFKETDLNAELDMIEVNVAALTALTKLFLPWMLAKKTGKILNIASTAAFQPGPAMAVYFATKAYVLSFSEALNEELRGTGVSVTTLCPGPTRTNFDKSANADKAKIFTGANVMDAARVAEIGYRALMNNKMTVIVGVKNKLLIFLLRVSPRVLVPRVVRFLQAE